MTNVLDLFRLAGKVAVVTGASSGLGAGFAHALQEVAEQRGGELSTKLDEQTRIRQQGPTGRPCRSCEPGHRLRRS